MHSESTGDSGKWILGCYCVLVFGGMALGVTTIWWVIWSLGGC